MKKKYFYYCDDCKCFVKEGHRCQQWDTVHAIPQEAIEQLLETAHNSDYAKCDLCHSDNIIINYEQ